MGRDWTRDTSQLSQGLPSTANDLFREHISSRCWLLSHLVNASMSLTYSWTGTAYLLKWLATPRRPTFDSRQEARIFLCHHFQTSCGLHPFSYIQGTVVKGSDYSADHSPPPSLDVKNVWSVTSNSQLSIRGVWRDTLGKGANLRL
jgi:hypothetical protein